MFIAQDGALKTGDRSEINIYNFVSRYIRVNLELSTIHLQLFLYQDLTITGHTAMQYTDYRFWMMLRGWVLIVRVEPWPVMRSRPVLFPWYITLWKGVHFASLQPQFLYQYLRHETCMAARTRCTVKPVFKTT